MLHSLFGLLALTAIAWLLAERRTLPDWRLIATGLGVQLLLAALLLHLPLFRELFLALNGLILALEEATRAGTSFVFGYVGGGDLPFDANRPGGDFILAFRALPLIIVVSALSALLFYWRILPLVVRGFAWLLQRSLGVGGALGLSAAANVFVGMTEAPLLVRHYLLTLSRGELFAVMTCGMATVAGTVMALYASFLSGVIPDAMGHILAASLISAPAALLVARLMIPHEGPHTDADLKLDLGYASSMDAVTQGTLDGIKLLLNVIGMLLVMVALVSLANQLVGLLPEVGGAPLSLERILGWLMAPLVWLMGIPWAEAQTAGQLMGIKTVLNELLAYLRLAGLEGGALSERSKLIMTYALCGFANLGSLGILIGGLATLVPERRAEVAALGLRSIVAGTLATCMTGAVVGVVGVSGV